MPEQLPQPGLRAAHCHNYIGTSAGLYRHDRSRSITRAGECTALAQQAR